MPPMLLYSDPMLHRLSVCLMGVLLAGCSQTIPPRLDPPPASLSAEQLAAEGRLQWYRNPLAGPSKVFRQGNPWEYATAQFSVPPEQLTALILQTAKDTGWPVDDAPRKVSDGSWTVMIQDPRKPPQIFGFTAHLVRILSSSDGQGSQIEVGDGEFYFPLALFWALQSRVHTYLAGQMPAVAP